MKKVQQVIAEAIESSSKSQITIARECGFEKPNIVTMLKQGSTKLPIARVPMIAASLGIDPTVLMDMCMSEYRSAEWTAIKEIYRLT